MFLVDANCVPVAVSVGPANPNESGLIQDLFGFMLPSRTPDRTRHRDKAYDSYRFDAELADQDIELTVPIYSNRSLSQDGRSLH